MLARLARVVLMVRKYDGSIAKATEFYRSGLGLSVIRATDDWVELRDDTFLLQNQQLQQQAQQPQQQLQQDQNSDAATTTTTTSSASASASASSSTTIIPSVAISLQAVTTESQLSTGYTPILNFQVSDMDGTVAKCVQLGGQLDGPIQYPAHGKVAVMRSPEGHMIGLYEPAIM